MNNPEFEASDKDLNEKKPVLNNNKNLKDYTNLKQEEDSAQVIDSEIMLKKEKFPKRVFLIILSEFCERFSYYGLRTVLIIYFTQFINISENSATAYFHTFTMICYFTPVFGAIIADCYIGKFKTILWISIVYCIGEVVLCLTSIKPLGAPNVAGPLVGLLIIGFATGGIKPCVSAFGGDQFKPTQKIFGYIFSLFYLSINIGAFIGSVLTPFLRSDVRCFGDSCYPLAFGVPTVLMFLAIIVFLFGKPLYTFKNVNREENLFKKLFVCIFHALKMKFKSRNSLDKKSHWLDYAEDRFDSQFIRDVKAFCKVVFMFLPVPMFWALFDQQGSRWTLQAEKLNAYLGSNFYLKPDQIQAINPVFILILIPTFNWIIYPLLKKCNLFTKYLQRMTVGMLLACVAFIASALLEYKIQEQFMLTNSKPNTINLINLTPFSLNVNSSDFMEVINSSNQTSYQYTDNTRNQSFILSYDNSKPFEYKLLESNDKYLKNNYLFYLKQNELKSGNLISSINKEPIGKSQLRVYYLNNLNDDARDYEASIGTLSKTFQLTLDINNLIKKSGHITDRFDNYKDTEFDEYQIKIASKKSNTSISTTYRLDNGARYTFIFYHVDANKLNLVQITDIQGNQIFFAYQFIQYFIITAAEIMFSISGLAFAYSQAPASMKSLLQAAWLLTVAFGNLVVVIVAEANLIKNQVYEYILFACLIFVSAIVFAIMGYFYVYTDFDEPDKKVSDTDVNEKTDENLKFSKLSPRKNSASSEVQLIRMSSLDTN